MKKIFRNKKTILLFSLVALILLLTYILFNTSNTSEQDNGLGKRLASIFTKTIYYLNRSTDDLDRAYNGVGNVSNYVGDIDQLISEYRVLEKKYFLYSIIPGRQSSLIDKLWRAYMNYYKLTNTSREDVYAAYKLSLVIKDIKKSMEYLLSCDINSSLNIYHKIKGDIEEILDKLNSADKYLSKVNDQELLNSKHVILKNKTKNTIDKVSEGLKKYISIMETVEENITLYKEICILASNTSLINETNKYYIRSYLNKTGGFKMIFSILDEIYNPEMGYATPESTSLKIILIDLLNKLNVTIPVSISIDNTTAPGGYGAGYYSYTRTD